MTKLIIGFAFVLLLAFIMAKFPIVAISVTAIAIVGLFLVFKN
jgi:hypothetical protein